MASKPSILQFKITLRHVKPPVWRRIQVPDSYTFLDLHRAIQSAMGWDGHHLHQFMRRDRRGGRAITTIGNPAQLIGDFGDDFEGMLAEDEVKVCDWFQAPKSKMVYEYDFGDGWEHDVVLEKMVQEESGVTYPRCTAGKRNCPPEDCGGYSGYEELLEILADPNHEEHKERMEWVGGSFDPEEFEPEDVSFLF